MGLTKLTDHQAALAQYVAPRVIPLVNRSVPLLQVMKTVQGKGKNLAWDVRYGTAKGTAIEDGADVGTFNSDTKKQAVLPWSEYHEAFGVSGRSMSAAAVPYEMNPAELADLWGSEFNGAMERLALGLGEAILVGDPSASAPEELAGLIDPTNGALKATGTYATLDKAVVTAFQGTELLNGGIARDLSIGLMRDTKTEIYNACGMPVDMIWCSPAMHATYGKLLGQNRRDIREVTLRGQRIVLDGGFTALDFDGIPVMMDQNIPDAEMLFLNSNYVELVDLPYQGLPGSVVLTRVPLQAMPEQQLARGETPLTCTVIMLAMAGMMVKCAAYVQAQLRVMRPNAHAILGDLRIA